MTLQDFVLRHNILVEYAPNGRFYIYGNKRIYKSNDKRVAKNDREIIEELEEELKTYKPPLIIKPSIKKPTKPMKAGIYIKKRRRAFVKSPPTTPRSIKYALHEKIDPIIMDRYNRGDTYRSIAEELNIPLNKVKSRVLTLYQTGKIKLRKKQKKWEDIDIQKLIKMYKKGKTQNEIADLLRISRARVSRKIQELRANGKI